MLDRSRDPRSEGAPVTDLVAPIESANDFIDRLGDLVEGGQLPGVVGLEDPLGRAQEPGCFMGVLVLNGGPRLLLTIATIPPQPEAARPPADGLEGDEELGSGS